jgi:peroxiredoxin Q/BCP
MCLCFHFSAFRKKGVEIVGVSSDADHSKFISQYDLGMTLLADVGGKLRTQYAVPKAAFGLLDGRVTYFIDKTGKVLGIYDNLTDAEGESQSSNSLFANHLVKSGS